MYDQARKKKKLNQIEVKLFERFLTANLTFNFFFQNPSAFAFTNMSKKNANANAKYANLVFLHLCLVFTFTINK